jgi:hypothetical protein
VTWAAFLVPGTDVHVPTNFALLAAVSAYLDPTAARPGCRESGPILRNCAVARMERHTATRRLRHFASDGVGPEAADAPDGHLDPALPGCGRGTSK